MKVLITGAGGQLGQALAALLSATDEVVPLDKAQLDVTDAEAVNRVIAGIKPDAVIHSAAYTQVDRAETDVLSAYAVNAVGTRNIAAAAAEAGAVLVYVSTDYVFNGCKGSPYTEFDHPEPLSVYGHSKLHGERFVQMLHDKFFIVRTSWLYGRGLNNFVGKILTAAREGRPLRVVNDEFGSPTFTEDLAVFLSQLIRTNRYGIYHASNTGYCSRYEQAKAVLEEAGLDASRIEPVPGSAYATAAPRPKHSALDPLMIRLSGLPELPPWREAIARCLHH